EKTTWRMSAYVSVPIIMAQDDEVRMQLLTTTFSTGRTEPLPRPRNLDVFRQMASSAVLMIESEISTLDVETMSSPSELTPRSRTDSTKSPRIHTRLQSCRRTFHRGALRMVAPSSRTSSQSSRTNRYFCTAPFR